MPYDRSQYVTRTTLDGIAFDFTLDAKQFIADSVFTPKVVDKPIKQVLQFDTSKLRVAETRRKTDEEEDLVDEQLFKRNITLEEHKLGSKVNPRDERDADIPALVGDARKTKLVTGKLLLKREELAATLATTAGNFNSSLTSAIASGSRWNEGGGDPEADKKGTVDPAILNSCGMLPNAGAVDALTLKKIQLSADFRDRVKYTQKGPVSVDTIMAFFEIDYLFIGTARRDANVEGAASTSIDGFWGTNFLFFVYNPSPSLEDVSFGHLFTLQQMWWTNVFVDERKRGTAGPMRRVRVGGEYVCEKGYVDGSGTQKFAAGYLLRTVVA